jgi:aspartate-semialdehyde dehydrogenase
MSSAWCDIASSPGRHNMPLGSESLRVVIAGAASLRGKDLKRSMEESAFPAGEIRLVDEELSAGTLTDLAGEPAVIQPVDDSTFESIGFAFFAGSPSFAARHAPAARRAGAIAIDLTGGLAGAPDACLWIPTLDQFLDPVRKGNSATFFISPSAPAIVATSFAVALKRFSPRRIVVLFFHPASERGQAGVDELEGQTTKLLTFQPMPQEIFDTQVAFNLLDRWGPASSERLADVQSGIRREVQAYLEGRVPLPALMLVQAPVFYGHAFAAYAEFAGAVDLVEVGQALESAGFRTLPADDAGASNIAVAGESQPFIGLPQPDPSVNGAFWFWGAADNMRLATANAIRIAGALLAT